MLFSHFQDLTANAVNKHIQMISNIKVSVDDNATRLFPTDIIFTQTEDFFIFELIGASPKPRTVGRKIRKCRSIDEYFGLFKGNNIEGNPAVYFAGSDSGFFGTCVATDNALDAGDRFPILNKYETKLNRQDGSGPLFTFGPEANNISIGDCLIASSYNNVTRCKAINFLHVLKKRTKSFEYKKKVDSILLPERSSGESIVHGVITCSEKSTNLVLMSQFQSLFLSSGVHETTIGSFVESHPEIIKGLFGTDEFRYEPSLDWIEHDGSVQDSSINPDLMVSRTDGYFDIVDLKLARTDRAKLTKGPRKRRRFVDYVYEGLSQLANYEFYFSFEKNRSFAYRKHGISVRQPRLFLVVGSNENIQSDEVNEALRAHGNSRFTIIDYDTLAQSLYKL